MVEIRRLIIEYAEKYDLDPALVQAQVWKESNFNPKAEGKDGEKGLLQPMWYMWTYMVKIVPGIHDPFNPAHNLDGCLWYMRTLIDKYDGDIALALAAYNAGEPAVERCGRCIPNPHYVNPILNYWAKHPTVVVPTTTPEKELPIE